MMSWLRMLGFHVRQYGRVAYFVRQLVMATVGAALVQWAAALPSGKGLGAPHWLLAAHIGLWVCATSAAGLLGFQRFQGTLGPLLVSPRRPESTLTALIASVTCFGITAFPLAYVSIVALGGRVDVADWSAVIVGAVVSWLGATAMALVIAPLFVLSPRATTYEQVLVVPLMLLMGFFGYPGWGQDVLGRVGGLFPMATGFRVAGAGVAAHPSDIVLQVMAGIASAVVWTAIAVLALRDALRRSRVDGSLDLT